MSLVREVSLVTSEGTPHLTQQAVTDPAALTRTVAYTELDVDGIRSLAGGAAVQLIEVTFVPGSAEEFGLVIRGNGNEGTRIGIRPGDGRLLVDRTASGNTAFHEAFASIDTAPLACRGWSVLPYVFSLITALWRSSPKTEKSPSPN